MTGLQSYHSSVEICLKLHQLLHTGCSNNSRSQIGNWTHTHSQAHTAVMPSYIMLCGLTVCSLFEVLLHTQNRFVELFGSCHIGDVAHRSSLTVSRLPDQTHWHALNYQSNIPPSTSKLHRAHMMPFKARTNENEKRDTSAREHDAARQCLRNTKCHRRSARCHRNSPLIVGSPQHRVLILKCISLGKQTLASRHYTIS